MAVVAVMSLSMDTVFASPEAAAGRFVIAQTSMGGGEALTTPPPRPMQGQPTSPSSPTAPPAPRESPPRMDYVPPQLRPPTDPNPNRVAQPNASGETWWGAVGFTADGSYSTVWKMASQAEAEAEVAKRCAKFGRGACETVSFSGQQCVGLATFIGRSGRKRWNLSFTAGGDTYPEAQRNAMSRCNADDRTRGRCQNRTVACADGR